MRTASGILLGSAAAIGLIALAPARAAAPVTIEKSLMGIRILQNYKDVLAKWGPPKLIARGGETLLYEPVLDPEGNDLGGIHSISYLGGSGGAGAGGGPGMGAKGGRGAGMAPPGSGGGPGPVGMSNRKGDMGPSSAGAGPGRGAAAGAGPGGAGGSDGGADTSFGESGSYKWVYHDPRHEIFYLFDFNLEGRVVYVAERGRDGGMPTQRGLHLGSSLASVYETYGWPDTIQEIEPGYVLDYGSKYHLKIAIIKDKVVGIGVVLEESQTVPFFPINGSGGGAGKGGGPAGPAGGGRGRASAGGGGSPRGGVGAD